MLLNHRVYPHDRAAFTLLEVLVLSVTVVAVAFVLVPRMIPRRGHSDRLRCVNNLKNVGLSFQIFATDNAGAYPAQVSTNEGGAREWLVGGEPWRQWVALSNELAIPKLLVCPEDRTRSAATQWASVGTQNLGYFLNLTAVPDHAASILAGDRNLLLDGEPVSPGRVTVGASHRVAWGAGIHRKAGNIVAADGAVHQLRSPDVHTVFRGSSAAGTNDLLVP